jgi:hypothetical protein
METGSVLELTIHAIQVQRSRPATQEGSCHDFSNGSLPQLPRTGCKKIAHEMNA